MTYLGGYSHPFTIYFDVHQWYRVLTHCPINPQNPTKSPSTHRSLVKKYVVMAVAAAKTSSDAGKSVEPPWETMQKPWEKYGKRGETMGTHSNFLGFPALCHSRPSPSENVTACYGQWNIPPILDGLPAISKYQRVI